MFKKIISETLMIFRLGHLFEYEKIQHFQKQDKFRIIFKVVTDDNTKYILKYFHDADVRESSLTGHAVLSDCYIRNGIKVPKRYQITLLA